MKLSKLAQVFARRPATGRRRRPAPTHSGAAPQHHQAAGQNVFLRDRPWTPPPFWCTVTAYYQYGQPMKLWSGGADSPRLAVRALRARVQALAVDLDLSEGEEQRLWLDTPAAEVRATEDLARGRSHAVAITHNKVVYIINATPSSRAETGTATHDLFCSA
ncbi:hypothetical protein ACIQI7_09025 [Kitasatospora sp. NPDC092039]|uniref:hypothetical protein n=1 Tax=Kitasatospora sp. NPDC092039 TaxID=3364086 RepID=UPI00380B40CF